MGVDDDGVRLMVFVTEDDMAGHTRLFEALVERAREDGVSGTTVWRGIEGYGPSGHLRTTRFPDAADGLPVVVEAIDTAERIEVFARSVAELAPGSLVTREPVRVIRGGADQDH